MILHTFKQNQIIYNNEIEGTGIGITLSPTCSKFVISGNRVTSGTYGINVNGSTHAITNNIVSGTGNVGIYLNNSCINSTITGNTSSSASGSSILEAVGSANYNNIQTNVGNAGISKNGAQSIAANNIVYP